MKLKIFSAETVPGIDEIREARKAKAVQEKHLRKVNALIPPVPRASKTPKRNAPVMKTRKVDTSGLRSFRIDHKTVVFVKPGADLQRIKQLYSKPAVL